MKKKFVSNILFLVLLNLIVKPFYLLGIDAGVQNAVGASEYGIYFALFSLSFLLNIFSDFGITGFNNRHIAQNTHLLDKHFSKIMSLRLLLIFVYIGIALFSGFFLGYSSRMMKLLMWIVLNQALASFILYLRSNLAGLHLFKRDSIISVLDRFLLIIFCGYALWGGSTGEPFKIEWFIGLQTLSYGITAIVALLMLRGQLTSIKLGINKLFSLSIIRQSLPYALLTLLMGLYHRMDSIMLERMLPVGSEASGIYAQGFRFLDALNNFSFLFAVILLPLFAKMLKEKTNINPVTLLSSKILLSGVIIISITAFFFSYDIMQWRYDENILKASETFSILILSPFFFALVLIFGTLLTADGRLKELNYIALAGVILNFSFNLWLIPTYLAWGSAIATLGTQIITALAHVLVAQRIFGLKTNWLVILKLVALTVTLYLIGLYSVHVEISWFVRALTMGGLGLIIAAGLQLISIKGFVELMKTKEIKT